MRKIKSTTRRQHMVAASSSNSDYDLSLGGDQKEAAAPTRDATYSSTEAMCLHSAEAMCLHSRVNSPASTRHIGGTTFQCKFVSVLVFFYTCKIIYEQLINILLFLFIFRFTNIETARVITSAFKSLMEIPLFQWSQLSKHPNWRPYIDARFRRFQVGVNF
jgi:hypothetical protein